MRFRKNIICSIFISFVAFAAVFCCCPKTAQASSSTHSCCPAKSDSTHGQQCPHQFIKGEKANLVSYEPNYLGKTAAVFVAMDQAFVQDPSSHIALAIDDGPPSAIQVPLYLQSHKLRL